jgi:hypothetical protein
MIILFIALSIILLPVYSILILFSIFIPLFLFYYWIISSITWDLYIFNDGIGFKSQLKIVNKKYKYLFSEIDKIVIKYGYRGGPFIIVFSKDTKKAFSSIGSNKTKGIETYLKSKVINIEIIRNRIL